MGETRFFFSPEFLKTGSVCVEACLPTSTQFNGTKNVFFCWIFPTVLLENPYCGNSFHCTTGTATMQRGLQELLSSWKWHCVPLPPGQVNSSGNFHLCYQTILPPGQASNFTADIFSRQPHSSASKAQQDLLPRAMQLWLQCTNSDHAVPRGSSYNRPFLCCNDLTSVSITARYAELCLKQKTPILH